MGRIMVNDEKNPIPDQGDMFGSIENTGAKTVQAEKITDTPEPGEDSDESFEVLLKRLEEIVEKMEDGGLSLDESMKLYEEGIKKADKLTAKLADARNKVMKLVENRDDKISLEVFDEGEAP